jgi:hypothetical protein
MVFKIIAAAAIMAVPAVAHAQGTTPAVPQDTTHTRIHTDSTKVDTSNGSVYTKKKTTVTDTTKSSRTRTDSTMNVTPLDTTRPPTAQPSKQPPR